MILHAAVVLKSGQNELIDIHLWSQLTLLGFIRSWYQSSRFNVPTALLLTYKSTHTNKQTITHAENVFAFD